MACRWCGDEHGVDRLCQRAQRGMSRRSFCFLFGAGIAGSLIGRRAPSEFETIAELTDITPDELTRQFIEFLRPATIIHKDTGLPFNIRVGATPSDGYWIGQGKHRPLQEAIARLRKHALNEGSHQ